MEHGDLIGQIEDSGEDFYAQSGLFEGEFSLELMDFDSGCRFMAPRLRELVLGTGNLTFSFGAVKVCRRIIVAGARLLNARGLICRETKASALIPVMPGNTMRLNYTLQTDIDTQELIRALQEQPDKIRFGARFVREEPCLN